VISTVSLSILKGGPKNLASESLQQSADYFFFLIWKGSLEATQRRWYCLVCSTSFSGLIQVLQCLQRSASCFVQLVDAGWHPHDCGSGF
jgi:hypothetical protein